MAKIPVSVSGDCFARRFFYLTSPGGDTGGFVLYIISPDNNTGRFVLSLVQGSTFTGGQNLHAAYLLFHF
jgi:hypothetical protein